MNKTDIINCINQAFKGVSLEGGINLKQAKIMDNYGSSYGPDNAGPTMIHDWSKIDTGTLELYPFLAHVDPLGFRFYIPAVMCSLLKEPNSRSNRFYQLIVLLNTATSDDRETMYSALSGTQRQAIAVFLRFLAGEMSLKEKHRTELKEIFEKYWIYFIE